MRLAECRIGRFPSFSIDKMWRVDNGLTKVCQTTWNHSKVIQNIFVRCFEVGSVLLVPFSTGFRWVFMVFAVLGSQGRPSSRAASDGEFWRSPEEFWRSSEDFLYFGRKSKGFSWISNKFRGFSRSGEILSLPASPEPIDFNEILWNLRFLTFRH